MITTKSIISSSSDYYGAAASSLCMIHCLLTPVLFAVQATSLSCSDISPFWWKAIDYFFLVITLVAILYTARTTSSRWVPKALFASRTILALLVVNRSFQIINIPHFLIYIPAVSLIALHIYNKRYCKCQEGHCCTE